MCGDYKVTVNKNLVMDRYPIPHSGLGITAGHRKTEAVVFKSQYGWDDLRFRIGDQAVQLGTSLKYLSIVLESKVRLAWFPPEDPHWGGRGLTPQGVLTGPHPGPVFN